MGPVPGGLRFRGPGGPARGEECLGIDVGRAVAGPARRLHQHGTRPGQDEPLVGPVRPPGGVADGPGHLVAHDVRVRLHVGVGHLGLGRPALLVDHLQAERDAAPALDHHVLIPLRLDPRRLVG